MRVGIDGNILEGDAGGVARDGQARRKKAVPPGLSAAFHLRAFGRTSALPCPYLSGQHERKLVTDISGPDSAHIYNVLSRAGFRRSHHLAYRPACAGCAACVPVRIVVNAFAPTRSSRRIANLNDRLDVAVAPPRATVEQFRLFSRYQRSRHAESDMASMTYGDYRAMVEDSPIETALIEARMPAGHSAEHRLIAACLIDILDDGLSAVYSFFDPGTAKRSLGTFMILSLIDQARQRGLPYVYLGYWVGDSPKMAYKTRFRPLEALGPQGWVPFP